MSGKKFFVFKTKSGSYVARTLDGKDVLVAK